MDKLDSNTSPVELKQKLVEINELVQKIALEKEQ